MVEDGRVAYASGYGEADTATHRPVTTATLFQAASVSKAVSALAVLLVFHRAGKSIDDPLPPLSVEGSSTPWTLPNPYPTPVTTRMLLAHLGGTNTFHYAGYRAGVDALPTLYQELTGAPPANVEATKVSRPPGVHWAYSPAGYTVLQAELADMTDAPFSTAMQQVLLDRLGMRESTFRQPLPAGPAANLAVPYIPGGAKLPDGARVFNTEASGGLSSTPTELAAFLIALQRGLAGDVSGPVPPEVAKAMMTRQSGTTQPGHCLPSADPNAAACQTSWGLGLDVNLNRFYQHSPDGKATGNWFAHTGFNSGYLTLAIASKTGGHGLVVMINVAQEDMNGSPAEFGFLMDVLRRVGDDSNWPE